MDATDYLTCDGRSLSPEKALLHMRLSGAWRAAAGDLRRSLAIRSLASRRGVEVADAELQAAVDGFRKMRGLCGAADTQAWLARQGASLDDLEEHVEARVLETKLTEAIERARIEAYFADHRKAFDTARLSVVQVDEESVAGELLEQVREGEAEFADLAGRHSTHQRTRDVDGGLGWCRRGVLREEVAEAVFAAKPGEVLGPYDGPTGHRLYRVEAVRKAELEPGIEREIRKALFEEDLRAFVTDHPVEERPFWKVD